MKYCLIIGYHLLEKNKSYPTIRLSIDNQFISEFECDNEKFVDVEHTIQIDSSISLIPTPYRKKSLKINKRSWTVPSKFKIFELDSSKWDNNHKLNIEILNNYSNYNNGFVSKRSLISFLPVYLIPTSLLKNKEIVTRLIKKIHKVYENLKNPYNSFTLPDRKKWCWPGPYPGPNEDDTMNFFGGNTKIIFTIKKRKQNFFYLTENNDNTEKTIGFPLVDHLFFSAWLNHFTKVKRDIKIERNYGYQLGKYSKKDKSAEGKFALDIVEKSLLQEINRHNEDQ